jgi:glycerophosphoryl diester phosphodiesterase
VHPYTLRNENTFLPKDYRIGANSTDYGRAVDEHLAFLEAGVDGVFTDNPDTGVVARSLFLAEEAA